MARAEIFNVPPADAVESFRAKGFHVGWDWRDTDAALHARSFTVAKAMRLDLLQDIRAALDKVIADGENFDGFVDRLEPTLRAKEWNCRCTVMQYSDPDLERRGYAPTKRPARPRRQWLNKRTGRVESVPVGIDPGFGFNAGRVDLGQEAAAHLIGKIDAAPPDMRAAAIGRPWDTARFKRFVKGRGRPAEQAAPGDWPIAITPPPIMRATEAKARVVRLSPDTARKQRQHHADIVAADYAKVQRILDAGEFYHSTPMHIIGYLQMGREIWAAVFKTTEDRQELFLQSLHRAPYRNLAHARRHAEKVGKATTGGP